jgi:pilus assembly protein CpaF
MFGKKGVAGSTPAHVDFAPAAHAPGAAPGTDAVVALKPLPAPEAPRPVELKEAPKPEVPKVYTPKAEAPKSAILQQGPLSKNLQDIKVAVFNDLIEAVDLAQMNNLDTSAVREEISDIVAEIIGMRDFVLSAQEQQQVIEDICNDVLGLGPTSW